MDPEVPYRIQNSPPLVPILNHIKAVQEIPSYIYKIRFNIN
jgi:hypothetical protein